MLALSGWNRSALVVPAVIASLAGCSTGSAQTLRAQPVATGLAYPLYVTHAPGDRSRMFIVGQRGPISIVDILPNGSFSMRPTPLINLAPQLGPTALEYGVIGMAFHPNFASNGYFYVAITPPVASGASTPDYAVARLRMSPTDPNVADPASFQFVLRVSYLDANHRAGWLDFGPDGYLYVATGDGGENDPRNAASDLSLLRGKILRIDVDGPDNIPGNEDDDAFPAEVNRNYSIPPTNPFVGVAGAQGEIWAYGLRNPWRGSFDRETGDFWLGDVGQSAREEIDYLANGSPAGAFFGWRCKEGTVTTTLAGCTGTLPPSIPPILEYPRNGAPVSGSAVVGGYVYRGCAIPALRGTYFFADWSGKIWSSVRSGNTLPNVAVRTTELTPTGGASPGTVVSFGEDALGELYFVSWNSTNGAVYKIVQSNPTSADCNGNGLADACDIAMGTSADANANGIPDECEVCRADFDGVGGVTTADIFGFLNAWFLGLESANFDGVPGLTITDIFSFLNAWFTGC